MKLFDTTIEQMWEYGILLTPNESELSARERVKEIAWKELVTIIPVEFRHKIKETYTYCNNPRLITIFCTFKPLIEKE